MPFEIIKNDICRVRADAIVNSANPEVTVGSGVDHAIYEAAGREELFAERQKIGRLAPGQVEATPAFRLDAEYILHTVGPVWRGGGFGERQILEQCYRDCLLKAKELGCTSVAFPLISAGVFGYPKAEAAEVAVSEIGLFLLENDMDVYLVIYRDGDLVLRDGLYEEVREYMGGAAVISDVSFIGSPDSAPYGEVSAFAKLSDDDFEEFSSAPAMPDFGVSYHKRRKDDEIKDFIKKKEGSFRDHLFRVIDRKGMSDPEAYKRANIDRRLFSKIKSREDYLPSKKTVLAFAIALKLNLDETLDLLRSAGYTLSNRRSDLIVEYCIEHHVWDINEVNCILFSFDQPLLGA